MSASLSILASRSTSVTQPALGSAAATRTPTVCSANISRVARRSPTTARNIWTRSPRSSTGDRVKPWAGSLQLRRSLSSWKHRQQQVLRPPHETTRQACASGPPSDLLRHSLEVLYPTTLIVRTLIMIVLAGLLIYSHDPLFISLMVVVGFGMILTGSSYLIDRRAAVGATQPAR